ncbi:MAG TPA: SGNH/GDSL hydrolase family protein, partial [Actinotalea sp.]|nr:SGNH/GDSL hydrolase family protein [Actinotalea sp.]
RRIRALGSEVVVGTCPDLGTIQPIAQPLRALMKHWSRDLAAAQTVAVVEAGGRTVSLADLLGPEFEGSPHEMFSKDRFHPSAAGYARVASALLPTVCAALGVWGVDTSDRAPERRRGEGVGPVAVAAGQAVKEPGTEVAPTEIAGQSRGPRGRWAVLLRRRPDDVPPAQDPVEAADGADSTADAVTEGAATGGAATDAGATASGRVPPGSDAGGGAAGA